MIDEKSIDYKVWRYYKVGFWKRLRKLHYKRQINSFKEHNNILVIKPNIINGSQWGWINVENKDPNHKEWIKLMCDGDKKWIKYIQ